MFRTGICDKNTLFGLICKGAASYSIGCSYLVALLSTNTIKPKVCICNLYISDKVIRSNHALFL